MCPRCNTAIETCDDVRQCPNPQAIQNRRSFLQSFLLSLLSIGPPLYILVSFENKLSLTLDIPFIPEFQNTLPIHNGMMAHLMLAIWHQNISGWDNFLRGYTSTYWMHLYQEAHLGNTTSMNAQWDVKLVAVAISLSRQIWTD